MLISNSVMHIKKKHGLHDDTYVHDAFEYVCTVCLNIWKKTDKDHPDMAKRGIKKSEFRDN